MFLSRLHLDVVNRTVQRVLSDPYRLHQALLLAFDPRRPGGGGRVLYRVEPEREEGLARVLVQSREEPAWQAERFREDLPVAGVDGPKRLSLAFERGQRLQFRLRANPTKRTLEGKRVAVTGEPAQTDWVRRKLSSGGFRLDGCRVRDEGMIHGHRRESGAAMTFLSVLYEGLVAVEDPAAALETITAGVGSAKAFGFGLLSVSRR